MYAYAPNGSPILGTLERLSGRAEISDGSFERLPDGTIRFDFAGETEIFYDDQETVERPHKGKMVTVYLSSDGNEWLETELVFEEEARG